MNTNRNKTIIAVVIIVLLVLFFVIKKKKQKVITLPVYDDCNPKPKGDSPQLNTEQNTNIVFKECNGIMGWYDCFPLKKGLKDGDGFVGSNWVRNLQKYLGIEVDGYFGENTETAVKESTGETVVDWWQYRNIKEAYYRLNPSEKSNKVSIIESK